MGWGREALVLMADGQDRGWMSSDRSPRLSKKCFVGCRTIEGVGKDVAKREDIARMQEGDQERNATEVSQVGRRWVPQFAMGVARRLLGN